MCYKHEEHKKIEEKLNEELKDVPEFISDYLTTLKSSRTKFSNWHIVRDLLEFFIKNGIIKRKSISEIQKEDFQKITFTNIIKYLDNLLINGNTLSTINTKKAVLGGFWTYLVTIDVVVKNVVHNIPKSKYKEEEEDKPVEIPTNEELESFITNINTDKNDYSRMRNLAIVKLFIGSGIRREELIGLDMEDIHLLDTHSYMYVLGKGKQQKKDKVAISDIASNYLREYLEYREIFIEELKKKGKEVDETPLFLTYYGKRITKNSVTKMFDTYSNKEIYPHMLRHLCGTLLYKKTKDIVIVQKQLRHKDVATAARYYVHISEDEVFDAVANL